MRPILFVCGVAVLLGLSANLLLWRRHVRAIAPVAAGVLGVALLASVAVWDAGGERARVPIGAAPAPAVTVPPPPQNPPPTPEPAAPMTPDKIFCAGAAEPLGPAASPLPKAAPGTKRNPPFEIRGLPGAPGPLVLSDMYHHGQLGMASQTVSNALIDLDDIYYVLAADSQDLFFNVEVGTPRVGDCALQLVYAVLRGTDGQRTQRIAEVPPGPVLARYHVAMACGVLGGNEGFGVCAWASTRNAPRPVFGAMWIRGTVVRASKEHLHMTVEQIVALADAAFKAIDT
jgi:hypothetical protein